MPLDPDISLGIQGVGAVGAPGGPLDMASKAQGLQSQINQNQLFRAQMQARQRFGAIMGPSPDPERAVKLGMQDPAVAAFAPELLSNAAGLQQTLTTTHGLEQTQSESALENFMKV